MFELFGNASYVPPVNWRPEPTFRGTWGILSSALSTLFLCLWAAVHVNITPHDKRRRSVLLSASRGKGIRGFLQRRGQEVRSVWEDNPKPFWLLIGLFAPELVVLTAWNQRVDAGRFTKTMQRLLEAHTRKPPAKTPWWKRWLNWCLRRTNYTSIASEIELNNGLTTTIKRRHKWTLVHSFYCLSGGFASETAEDPVRWADDPFSLTLTREGIEKIAGTAHELLPDISKDDISDKSKADKFIKAIAALQVLWFCTQTFTRIAQRIAISLLELNVLAHSICAILIWMLWLSKPLDVSRPTIVQGQQAQELGVKLADVTPTAEADHSEDEEIVYLRERIPDWTLDANFGNRGGNIARGMVTLFASGWFYGGIHVFAWNAPFATDLEAGMWKISVLILLLLVPGGFLLAFILQFWCCCYPGDEVTAWIVGIIVVLPGAAAFVFARLYLVVECFIQLSRLPDSAYETPQWTRYVPHFG